MKRKFVFLLIAITIGFNLQAQLVVNSSKAPTIDGIIDSNDPWGDTWISQDAHGDANTTSAMNSKFQITHDTENIYIIVNVADSTPAYDKNVISNSWERDCINTCFSFKSSDLENTQYTYGDHHIECQRADEDNEYVKFYYDQGLRIDEDVKYAVKSDPNGYIIELAYNIKALSLDSDFDGVNFRCDIYTSDNTTGESGGRTQMSFWNSNTDFQWVNTTVFGNMVLAESIAPSFPVTFTVSDENSTPIDGASVNLSGYNTQTTDVDGKTTFSEVFQNSDLKYTIKKSGFATTTNSISVTDTTNLDVLMNTAYSVTINVSDVNLTAIEDAEVNLTGYGSQVTDINGNVIFEDVVPASSIAYTVNMSKYLNSEGTITITDTAVIEYVVLNLITYPLTFKITDTSQLPIEGAIVELTGYSAQSTNKIGEALFENITPSENIAYSVSLAGYKDTTGTVTLIDKALTESIILTLLQTSINNYEANSLRIYPNPVSNTLTISSPANVASLNLLNTQGQVVYEFKDHLLKNRTYHIDVSELPCGIYLVKADAKIERIVIE